MIKFLSQKISLILTLIPLKMNSGTADSPVLHSETDKNSNENWLVQFDSFPMDDPYMTKGAQI